MSYIRGLTERGIVFDPATQTFTADLVEGRAYLDAHFAPLGEGRWTFRRTSLVGKVSSFFGAVASGKADQETIERRKRSCLGGQGDPPCPALVRTTSGSYCGACSCGRWLLAKLDGEIAPKLGWKNLTCPLRRPGFSNEVQA